MGDKLIAGLVTFGAILPLCAICVLGPAAVLSLIGAAGAWLGGFGLWAELFAAVAAGLLIYRRVARQQSRERN